MDKTMWYSGQAIFVRLRLLDRPAPFEHLNINRGRCEIPQFAGALEPDLRFWNHFKRRSK